MSTVKNCSPRPVGLPDGRSIPPGEVRDGVELTDPHVAGRIEDRELVHVPGPDDDTGEPTVKELIAVIRDAETLEELERLWVVETSRDGEPRKGVADAIDRRRAQLLDPNNTPITEEAQP